MARHRNASSMLVADLRTWVVVLGLIAVILGYVVTIKRDINFLGW